MAIQKPGEWANSLLARFEDQVSVKHQFSRGFAQGAAVEQCKKAVRKCPYRLKNFPLCECDSKCVRVN